MIFSEAAFESAMIELFENMGYTHIYARIWAGTIPVPC